MTDKYSLEFHFDGEKFDAEQLNPKEIADLMITISEMITAIVVSVHPSLDIDEDDIVLGLSSVTQGSLNFKYVTTFADEVHEATEITRIAIATENYDAMPVSAIRRVEWIRGFNQKYTTNMNMWRVNGKREEVTTITPNTKILYNTAMVRGQTQLYGKLVRIGGDDPPRAVMRFVNGTKISCRVKNEALAQQMAHHLYEQIGVGGIAKWYVRDMSLSEFRVTELLPYRKTSLGAALKSLSDIASTSYEKIDDLPAYIAGLRGKDESEP